MAFEEVPEQPKRSNFWKPTTVGELKEGQYIRQDAPKTGKEKFGCSYIIREPDGHELSLPNHADLSAKMATLKTGYYVKIEYKGKNGKEFTYTVQFDKNYKAATTLDNPISSPEGQVLSEMKKADGWDTNTFSQIVMRVCLGDMGAGFALTDRLKKEGKIFEYSPGMWKAV